MCVHEVPYYHLNAKKVEQMLKKYIKNIVFRLVKHKQITNENFCGMLKIIIKLLQYGEYTIWRIYNRRIYNMANIQYGEYT
jgi:hypothetical protein